MITNTSDVFNALKSKIKNYKNFIVYKTNLIKFVIMSKNNVKGIVLELLPKEFVTNEVIDFARVAIRAIELYARKNKDYGNSFNKAMKDLGSSYAVGRLYDKINRIISITRNNSIAVADEKLDDTLIDLANYSMMWIAYNGINSFTGDASNAGSDYDIDQSTVCAEAIRFDPPTTTDYDSNNNSANVRYKYSKE